MLPPPQGAAPWSPPTTGPVVPNRRGGWTWSLVVGAAVLAGVGGYRMTSPDPVAPPAPSVLDASAQVTVAAEPRPAGPGGLPSTDSIPQPTTTGPSTATCQSELGWELHYPSGWFTSECDLFAPVQIDDPDDAAVTVLSLDGTWDEVIVVATPDDREVLDSIETTIAGRRALVLTSRQIEPGWYELGTLVYEIYLDDGWRLVVLSTSAVDGDLADNAAVVDGMAASLVT